MEAKGKTPRKHTHDTDSTGEIAKAAAPMASAAALTPGTFSEIAVRNAIPISWVDQARKAVQY